MTWSIVARDRTSGGFGVAVASKFFAVGAVCPYLASGAGALSTQSLVNPLLGGRGLRLLEAGVPAAVVVEALIGADAGRAVRQFHVVDRDGGTAAHTGAACIPWAGHRAEPVVSVAGNMLVGPAVVDESLRAFEAHPEAPLAERLLRALDAGDRAGGDKRGRQSAALVTVAGEPYRDLDIRVDDHADPIGELWRLYEVAHDRFMARRAFFPTEADPVGICDFAHLDAAIEARLAAMPRPDFGTRRRGGDPGR
jgi:uncharacterized Ntn-hydrolase superfamily protein